MVKADSEILAAHATVKTGIGGLHLLDSQTSAALSVAYVLRSLFFQYRQWLQRIEQR